MGLKLPLTFGDIAFLVEEIYRGRSAITGVPTRLVLVRWRKPEGSTVIKIGEGKDLQKSSNVRLQDLVCMTKEEAANHDKLVHKGGKKPEEVYDAEVVERVKARLLEIAEYEKLR